MSSNLFLSIVLLQSFLSISALNIGRPKVQAKFLEGNSWLWKLQEFTVLVDPVMSTLDFGIPVFYSGNKKTIDGQKTLESLTPSVDFVLLSQGLDDHAHAPTLQKLFRLRPSMKYVAPPSAKAVLNECGIVDDKVTYILNGKIFSSSKGGYSLDILSTDGAVVGPPWQAPENGYIVSLKKDKKDLFSLYYEPHCMYDPLEIGRFTVDCVITPIVSQELPFYTLVAGGEKALKLAKTLKAKTLIPMSNGELDQSGVLAKLLSTRGSVDEFQKLVSESGSNIKVKLAPAGELIELL